MQGNLYLVNLFAKGIRRFLILIICVLVLSYTTKRTAENSTTAAPLPDTTESVGVESRVKVYYADMSNRDWLKYRSGFWPNATITIVWQQPGGSAATVDVTAIDDFIKETPDGPDIKPVFEEKTKKSEIWVKGNIAEAWVKYKVKFGTLDSLMQWTDTDVFTMLQHDGERRIVSLLFERDQ